MRFPSAFAVVLVIANGCPADGEEFIVDTKFEGGSARVIEIDQKRGFIRIMPGGDPARGWPAWW